MKTEPESIGAGEQHDWLEKVCGRMLAMGNTCTHMHTLTHTHRPSEAQNDVNPPTRKAADNSFAKDKGVRRVHGKKEREKIFALGVDCQLMVADI